MHRVQAAFFCAGMQFSRRLSVSKTYLALVVMLIFGYYMYSSLNDIAAHYNLSVSPWIFLFFLSFHLMLLVHGGLGLLLYSDAGENDAYSYLVISRCGRGAYMAGQFLEILFSSFLYTVTLVVISLLFVAPSLAWDEDWGILLRSLASSSGGIMCQESGVSLTIGFSEEVFTVFTPIQVMLMSFFCTWLSTAFMGVLICFCRVFFEKSTGVVLGGLFICLSLFAINLGYILIGSWLTYISPLTWANFLYLDWYYSGMQPSPAYAFSVWVVSILAMSVTAVVGFCRRDIR